MAKKLNKSTKQILSVGFHLVVLACMVVLFDLAKPLVDKLNPGELISSKEEKKESGKEAPSIEKESSGIRKENLGIQKESAAIPVNPEKGGGQKTPAGGTTMADLMAQKKEKQKQKAEPQKKEE